jgi:hypothetical protein
MLLRDATLLSDIPIDLRIRSHSIKSALSTTSIRRTYGAIGNSFKLSASRTVKMAEQDFYRLGIRLE